jgi:hypothetical protein
MTAPWPWPADTTADRARTIARAYRAELAAHAPHVCAALDQRATEFGETWVVEPDPLPDDEPLPAATIAAALGVRPATIRQWTHRGIVPRRPGGWVLAEVRAALAARDQARLPPARRNA